MTCAVLASGHIDCWGYNGAGQLGDDSTNDTDVPVEVQGLSDATAVRAAYAHACALLSSGRIDCWGGNEWGELGDGSTTGSETPVEVKSLTTATSVAVGWEHTCASLASGNVECWGRNFAGELGNGSSESSDTPVEVASVSNAIRVEAGAYHTCALLSSRDLDCWGANGYGQLGNATYYNAYMPAEAQGVGDAAQVTAGGDVTCAVLLGGTINCWGENHYGELGNGLAWSPLPGQVLDLLPPAVSTWPASAVSQSSATMHGTVNPEGREPTKCVFEYGPSEEYGSSLPCPPVLGSGESAVAVSAQVVGLGAGTLYHFRIAATNASGTNYGEDQVFTTPPTPPVSVRAPSLSAAPVLGGSTIVGRSAAVSPGVWAGGVDSFVYQWQRCTASGSGCVNIRSGRKPAYTVASADLGHRLRVIVTAGNKGGATSASSGLSQIVGAIVESRVEWVFRYSRRYTQVSQLFLLRLPARASVELRCDGGGCPFSRKHCTANAGCTSTKHPKRRSVLSLSDIFAGTSLRPGSKLTVLVTVPHWIGLYYTFTMRSGEEPTHQRRCLLPDSRAPRKRC
jgi:regulator of chromosome condensation (RCC1) repeat-containing protein